MVLAEHHGAFLQDYNNDPLYPSTYVGTRYVSTYLHGPLGPIARTAEYDDNDVTNNRDIYYLRDAMGGHTGLLMDDDDNPVTPSRASFATYDAFGNGMSPGTPSALAGSFAWRGAEGSVYDTAPNLVYMQARHYDPTMGRFIQPDTLALANTTTQGMNRYIYCENDPVNHSDPTGHFVPFLFFVGAFTLGAILGGLLASQIIESGMSAADWILRIEIMLGFGVANTMARPCSLAARNGEVMLSALLAEGLIGIEVFVNLLMRTILGFMGVSFLMGFAVGFLLTSAIMLMFAGRDEDDAKQPFDDENAWKKPAFVLNRYRMFVKPQSRSCLVA